MAEAFRWSVTRRVTKTATVSLLSNRYQVGPELVGKAVELRFDHSVEPAHLLTSPSRGAGNRRAFFEGLVRDHLDVGRPDLVSLVFGRRVDRRTPGRFETKVVTKGVEPEVTCYYRSSRIKQYFKGHHALRTETVICDR
jgi:hypothetical protein